MSIGAAVLGLFVWAPVPALDGLDELARRITVPVMFLLQWDDEMARRPLALDLFDLLGSRHKTLHANPGAHLDVPGHEAGASLDFLVRHLTGPAEPTRLYPA